MKLLLIAPFLLTLAACGTTGGGGGSSAPAIAWTKPTGTVKISDTITIGSKDYAYKTVDGGGLSGNGDQSENQEPPFIMKDNARLKRVIAKSWPESVSVQGNNCLLENVEIPDVGEDAISTKKENHNKSLTIRNSKFAKAADKIIQLNRYIADTTIDGCEFDGYKSAIRIKYKTGPVTIKNCTFMNGLRAIVLDKDAKKPTIINCKFYNTVDLYRADANE